MGAARRGAGFSSLGTIDRIVYDNYEPLVALAAAAAVTERIGLATTVLLGPLRENAVELAKQALSVHALSGGRLTLGIGLGGRDDDYEVSGVELGGRGERARRDAGARSGRSGPATRSARRSRARPRLIVGGHADASYARAARFGDGWIAARLRPRPVRRGRREGRGRLGEAGREGEPRLMALAYFSLGERAEEDARRAT